MLYLSIEMLPGIPLPGRFLRGGDYVGRTTPVTGARFWLRAVVRHLWSLSESVPRESLLRERARQSWESIESFEEGRGNRVRGGGRMGRRVRVEISGVKFSVLLLREHFLSL